MFNTGPIFRRLSGTVTKMRVSLTACTLLLGVSLLANAQEAGQTPRPMDNTPVTPRPEEERVRLDKDLDYFQYIEDDGPLPNRANKLPDPKKDMAASKELKAYEYILAKANKEDQALLAKFAIKNVPYPNLFKDIRQEYLRELIHIEGRLSLILPMKSTDDLRNFDKIDNLYEAWIYPKGQSNPLCLVVSELPPGVEPGENQNLNVSFDGYFFKLFHYESRKDKPNSDGKKQWMKAPLFLGKTFTNYGPPVVEPVYNDYMLMTLLIAVGGLTLLIIALGFWLKKGGQYVEHDKQRRLEQSGSYLENEN